VDVGNVPHSFKDAISAVLMVISSCDQSLLHELVALSSTVSIQFFTTEKNHIDFRLLDRGTAGAANSPKVSPTQHSGEFPYQLDFRNLFHVRFRGFDLVPLADALIVEKRVDDEKSEWSELVDIVANTAFRPPSA
jgi:hypothetical protein